MLSNGSCISLSVVFVDFTHIFKGYFYLTIDNETILKSMGKYIA